MNTKKMVFVAMSGGVDSAVTAAKLLAAGYNVTGVHMETWLDPKWQEQVNDLPTSTTHAKKAAEALGIPFISLDVRDRFYTNVVQNFISQYMQGNTPNPCLFCNPQVKWGILQAFALEHGADYFATGHYARIDRGDLGRVRLLRGIDRTKDQSYVLSMLSQYQLSRSLLPLGELTKDDVRTYARRLNLPVADRQDSQDLCFLGGINYRDFLQRFAPTLIEPGEIVNEHREVLGEHQGLPFYTIGQRKGIRVAAPEPYYVVAKDIENNRLVIAHADQAEKSFLAASQVNWISGETPETNKIFDVMVRYGAKPIPAVLASASRDDFRLELKDQLRGITPGQVAVLFHGEVCLGGGVIITT